MTKEEPLRYYIHKHHAEGEKRPHFDFRLQQKDKLISWQLPVGPSMEHPRMRLAYKTEAVPFEFGPFEGYIPEGRQGSGEVILWDKGVFFLIDRDKGLLTKAAYVEEALPKALRRGELMLLLNGTNGRLKGHFSLFRWRQKDDDVWLLKKVKDKNASKDEILKVEGSVLSGKTLHDIREEEERRRQQEKVFFPCARFKPKSEARMFKKSQIVPQGIQQKLFVSPETQQKLF